MRWPPATIVLLLGLGPASILSLSYAVFKGMADSADLERRVEEVALYRDGADPYRDPDNTYPPSALPVFSAAIPVASSGTRRAWWIVLNLAALGLLCGSLVGRWGGRWPPWTRGALCLAVAASKPVRAGIALGQFHLIPTALIVAAEALAGRAVVSGVLVGLATIKPTMTAPYLIVLAVKGRWRTLGVAGLVQAGLWELASFRLGIGPIRLGREWLRNARSQITMGTIDLPTLAGKLVPPSRLDPSVVSLVVLAGSGVGFLFLRKKTGLALMALALVSAAVLTYHRHYDMVLLLPSVAYFLDAWSRGRGRGAGLAALAFGLILIVPTNPGITGRYEPLFDVAFVAAAYAMAAGLVGMVATEPPEAAA